MIIFRGEQHWELGFCSLDQARAGGLVQPAGASKALWGSAVTAATLGTISFAINLKESII